MDRPCQRRACPTDYCTSVADISLVWFSINDEDITATREYLRALAVQFGFPSEVLARDSKVSAFVKACKTKTTYVDAAGQQRQVSARESKRSSEFITFQLVHDGGLKLAEYKFFQSRRTRTGLVKGSHVVRSVLRRNLSEQDASAAQEWLKAAGRTYAQLQEEAPYAAIRRQARLAILSVGVPILGRESMYFLYDDDIDVAHHLREYLAAASSRRDFTIVTVDDDSDREVFAASADAALVARLEYVIGRLKLCSRPGAQPMTKTRRAKWSEAIEEVRVQHARHQRRLSLPLVQTALTLPLADQLMKDLSVRPPSGV